MIDLVVFDMAGTTVHDGDAVLTCLRAALAEIGVGVQPAAIKSVMGLHKPEAIRRLLDASGRPGAEGLSTLVHEDFVARMKRYYAHDPAVREADGASDVLAKIRSAGIKVALNTGFSRSIVDVITKRLGWDGPPPAVDATVASDEVARGRPYPDMIRLLMNNLSVGDPLRVAKIGDTVVDIEEGHRAGCGLVVGITTGGSTREQLSQARPTHVIDSLYELLPLVIGANAG